MLKKICLSIRLRSMVVLLLTLAFFTQFSQSTAYAAGDRLDTSFGNNGVETTTVTSPALTATIFSIAIDSAGKVVAGGYATYDSRSVYTLAR